jgi:hypothetical protein
VYRWLGRRMRGHVPVDGDQRGAGTAYVAPEGRQ